MKTYGMNKATEFTKKQISVIYGKAKRGELKVEKWIISEMYDLADYYGYDDNHSIADQEREVLNILKAVFEGTNEEAQELINEWTERMLERCSNKKLAQIDRNMLA